MKSSLIVTVAIIAFGLASSGDVRGQERQPPKRVVDPAKEMPIFNPFLRAMRGLPTHDNAGNAIPHWGFALPAFAPGNFRVPERPFGNGIGGMPGGYGGVLILEGKLPGVK